MITGFENGSTNMTGMYYLDTAAFACDDGYELVGASFITCQYGGNWSDTVPVCRYRGMLNTQYLNFCKMYVYTLDKMN